tara:strand:- start:5 stop:898 length:894 start_codon:yes stop_codon:yes gene_type:complete
MRLLFILLISISSYSQTIQLTVDTNVLRIGEQFKLNIILNNTAPDSIFSHEFDSLFNQLQKVSVLDNKNFKFHEDSVWKEYIFTSFDTGLVNIPTSQIVLKNNDTLLTNEISVNFLSVPLDTANKFFDIKPPKEIPFKISELVSLFKYLLILVLLLIITYFIYYYFKPQKKETKNNISNLIPVDVYFLEKIKILEEKKYLNKNRFKIYYSELSEIFRGYLESRFNIPALESSSYDLKLILNKFKISEQWFADFFRTSDIVKFAKGEPSVESSVFFIKSVKEFIIKHKDKTKDNDDYK